MSRCLLTTQMIAREAIFLVNRFPQDESDGLFGMNVSFEVSDEILALNLECFSRDYLQPALLLAWDIRFPPITDVPFKRWGEDVAIAIDHYGDLSARAVRYFYYSALQDLMIIDVRRGAWN